MCMEMEGFALQRSVWLHLVQNTCLLHAVETDFVL